MSAWDIAGAVGTGALVLVCARDILRKEVREEGKSIAALVGVVAVAWLAFCIARLLGAHA